MGKTKTMLTAYERLLDYAINQNFKVYERFAFKSKSKGMVHSGIRAIALSKTLETDNERRCVLAEEIAHAHFGGGNILDTRLKRNAKIENFTRRAVQLKLIPLDKLIDSMKRVACYQDFSLLAEDLEVSPSFLKETLRTYQQKYGEFIDTENYRLYFNPLRLEEK